MCSYVARKKSNLVQHVRFHDHQGNQKLEPDWKCASLRPPMVEMSSENLVSNSNGKSPSVHCVQVQGEKCSTSRLEFTVMDRVAMVAVERICLEII